MDQITLMTFEKAVSRFFEPIARQNDWPLIRLRQDVYEIPSPRFAMRIRFDAGAHTKNLNATLIPINQMPGDIENGGSGELGVAVIAGYNGIDIQYIPRNGTEEGFFAGAQYVADLAKTYAIPYLLGTKSDWDKVQAYIAEKTKKTVEEIKQYKFPPRVQKRWHLPPPPKAGSGER